MEFTFNGTQFLLLCMMNTDLLGLSSISPLLYIENETESQFFNSRFLKPSIHSTAILSGPVPLLFFIQLTALLISAFRVFEHCTVSLIFGFSCCLSWSLMHSPDLLSI